MGIILAAPPSLADNVVGKWLSPAEDNWPLIPIHAALTPDGRVLSYGTDGTGRQTAFFVYDIWDPAAHLGSGHITLDNFTMTDIFCSSQVVLPQSGSILIAGGDNWTGTNTTNTGNNNSNLYEFSDDTLSRGNDMNRARWYSSATVLRNGEVYIQGGTGGADRPEVRELSGSFRLLNNVDTSGLAALYPRNFLAQDGRVFGYDTAGRMYYVDATGTGVMTSVGQFSSSYAGWTSSAAMYRPGRILQMGGNSNGAIVIDITSGQPVVTPTQSMSSRRQWVSATVMADGRVVATGGSENDNQLVGVNNSAEIWDPATGQWTVGPSGSRARLYHSTAILLPDASVFVGGGGAPGPLVNRHVEIYYPPYLFDASGNFALRPTIETGPETLNPGQEFTLGIGSAEIQRVTMVKTSSVTHSVNMDQRFLELSFTSASGTLFVQAPSAADAPPGYYMVFVFNAQGAPSVAHMVRLNIPSSNDTEPPTTPTGLTATAVSAYGISLSWNASTDNVAVGGYRIFRNGVEIGTTSDTSFLDTPLSPSTTYSYTVRAYDTATPVPNESANSAPASATTLTASIDSFQGQDIGAVGIAGTSSFNNGIFTVQASGDDIWNNADGFHYVWWILYGDGQLTARVASLTQPDVWAKAGVMVREQLTATSRHASTFVTPANGTVFQYRTVTGGSSGPTGNGNVAHVAPYWVRIKREGDLLTGYISADGVKWTQRGQITLGGLPENVYIGLALTSHNNSALATATFDNVLLEAAEPPPPPNSPPILQSIANQTGTAGTLASLQVVASDPDGDPLTYSATGLPPGLSINTSSGLISGTPSTAGTYPVTVSVSDGADEASTSFTWTIIDPDPLVLDPMPKQPPREVNTAITYTATSHNGVNTEYRWQFDDGSETAWSSSPTVTHTFTQPTIYWVAVSARDDRGFEQTQTFSQLIHLPLTANAPASSGNIATSPNRLWVVNQDNDSVSVFSLPAHNKLAEVTVGKGARALALAPNGEAWVSNKHAATISVIDPATLAVSRTINLPYGSQPFGIAFAPDGPAFVALEALGQVLKLDSATGAVLGSAAVGSTPRHVSVTADGTRVYVSHFITPRIAGEYSAAVQVHAPLAGGRLVVLVAGTMSILDNVVLRHSDDPDSEISGSGIPNYLGPVVISPDGRWGWVPSKKDNIRRGTLRNGANLNFQNTVRSISSRVDVASGGTSFGVQVDHDDASLASAAAFDAYGVFLFVALETSREVAVVDAHNLSELFRISVGRAPQGVALSDDGLRLYVHNFMDRTVGAYDLTDLIEEGLWNVPQLATLNSVEQERLSPVVLKGKQFFYDARDTRLAREGYMSCASCHNDGGHDGRVWDLTGMGEGLRNTIALRGRGGGHGFLHWSGNFDEVQDFEGQIRQLAGGTGLMRDADFNQGTRSHPLGDPKAGISEELDALAAYLASLTEFAPSPYRNQNGSLTAAGAAGRTVFQQMNCAQCHGGAGFTTSGAATLYDIGTIRQPTSGQRLGGILAGIDPPTLRDVWATPPYLHDGSAATLEEAVLAHDGVSMSAQDLASLVAYLQQIDGNEPAPPTPNTAPTIDNPGNQSGVVGTAASLQIVAADADGDPLSFSATGLPGGLAIHASTGLISGTPTTAGSFSVTVSVDDGRGASASTAFTWTIQAGNTPPTIDNPGNQSGVVGTAASLQIVAADADGDPLSFSATGLPSGLTINASTGLITGTPSKPGNSSVVVTVTDGKGGFNSVSFRWFISRK